MADAEFRDRSEDLFRAVFPGTEVREEADGAPVLFGHFARFNEHTIIDSMFEGRFVESIAPGAFAASFERGAPKPVFQHGRDPEMGDKVLGSPMTVREDDHGAYYEVPLFPSVPPLVVDGLRAGAYGASFRFNVDEEDVDRSPQPSTYNPEGLPERIITRATVHEAGPVTYPAYAGATAGVRSLTDEITFATFTADPARLAAVIDYIRADTEQPEPEPAPEPAKAPPRKFRTREEYLSWLSKT